MVVRRRFGIDESERDQNGAIATSADILLSRRTMDTVVVFSSDQNFVAASQNALTKQGLILLPVNTMSRLMDYCSAGYLNFLLDCNLPDLGRASSITAIIRSGAPNSFIVAYCPNTGWGLPLMEAGANAILDGKQDVSLQIMEASTGFFENINAIVSRQLKSTRRKMKEAEFRSRIEKATARVARLSLKHMLQTDANVRAFFSNSWPCSRHGQYVAITEGETIGFGSNSKELAEKIKHLTPSGNIPIQKIDCENDLCRQYDM